MEHRTCRLIEMHLQHGDVLVAQSDDGKAAPCAPHAALPNVYTVDTSQLTRGAPFRYVVHCADGSKKFERFFTHSLEYGGPLDVWEGVRAVDNSFYVKDVREHFDQRGFAVVQGVLSADVVTLLRAVVDPLFRAAWGKQGAAFRDKINLEKVLLPVPHLMQAMAEKLGPLLRALMGDNVFLEYEQVMVVRADSAYATRCHRDVDGGKDGFSEASKRHKASVHLFIPLIDIDETRAGLYVNPFDAPQQSMNIRMRAGDALFLHNYVWHGSHPNTSEEHRLSWLLNFAPAPSCDDTNPNADLNLQLLRHGAPTELDPAACARAVRDKPTFLNLFDAFFTYDASRAQMVHEENRLPPEAF